ncbi:glycosyltransferase WbsX family protein [Phocaeicola plebeius]|uniref:glycosyltransferase WbsX family protein n=1 Tax=Phocaeicola plebeius TaxID=310297 RepID=UPI003F9B16C8
MNYIIEQYSKPLILAYYLPQFHPFKENDEWWGKGFTEWTNVGKAKPLYKGHYQPKVPADLGYYDLRLPIIATQQAELAKEAGIGGFCYWHYWFGNGKELMEMPFNRAVQTGNPDFPFCLGWANESWMAKQWSKNGSTGKTLIEQKYTGKEDNELHFYKYKDAFSDSRYIRINNRPFFLIYRPLEFKDIKEFMKQWNTLIQKEGIADSFYFVAHARYEYEYESLIELGFDAVNIFPLHRIPRNTKEFFTNLYNKFHKRITGIPRLVDYKSFIKNTWNNKYEPKESVLPTLMPNWDHSPRSGKHAVILENSTPDNWRSHIQNILQETSKKKNKIIMLKSWNEWGEGNYMEPDLKYGKSYIKILNEELKKLNY